MSSVKSIWDTRFSTSKARTFSEALERSGWALDGWVTMNGSRVLIGEAGEILGDLGGEHNGENVKDLKKSDKEEKPAQSTTTVEKPVLSSNRAEAETQIRNYLLDKRKERFADGTRRNPIALENENKFVEAAEARRQIQEDVITDRYPLDKEFLQRNVTSCEPGNLPVGITKEQKINGVGHFDHNGACASITAAYVAADKLNRDVEDRGKSFGDGLATGQARDAIKTMSAMTDGLIRAAGGKGVVLAENFNRPIDGALSLLKEMEVGKEYVFSAAEFGSRGHVTITRRVEGNAGSPYQYLELQAHNASWPYAGVFPSRCNGWKELTPEALSRRFKLPQTTEDPVALSMIETGKLANSKEFQEILPYVNGKSKQNT